MKTKKQKIKFDGHPFSSLLLITVIILLVSFVFCFLALFVGGFISIFIKNEAAVMIIMGIALALVIIIGSLFVKMYVLYDEILEVTYKQARTFWFNSYSFILINVNLFIMFICLARAMDWNFVSESLISFPTDTIAKIEERLGFGIVELLTESKYKLYMREDFSSPSLLLFFYATSMIFSLATFFRIYLEESCLKCGRAFIMKYDFSKEGNSYMRAEFEETGGYWKENKASVSVPGEIYDATVSYDTYVPRSKEFKGVYKYTDKTSHSHCPLCGREKIFHWTSSDRIL